MSSEAIQLSASLADSVARITNGSRLRQRTTVLSIASSSSTNTLTGFLWPMAPASPGHPAPPAPAIRDPLDLVECDQEGTHPGEPRLRRLLQARGDDISQLGRKRAMCALDHRDRRGEMHHTKC